MPLTGVLQFTIEYAKGLKDLKWFSRQSPYCTIYVGGQAFRTKTATRGGRDPVWNETFQLTVLNENVLSVEVKDDDAGNDAQIGTAVVSLAHVRTHGIDKLNVAVRSKRSGNQHGFISVVLKWVPTTADAKIVPTRPPPPPPLQRASKAGSDATPAHIYEQPSAPPLPLDRSSAPAVTAHQSSAPPQPRMWMPLPQIPPTAAMAYAPQNLHVPQLPPGYMAASAQLPTQLQQQQPVFVAPVVTAAAPAVYLLPSTVPTAAMQYPSIRHYDRYSLLHDIFSDVSCHRRYYHHDHCFHGHHCHSGISFRFGCH
ncbi:hypothetical protein Vafri_480 [Volvox africanus]|nr:hypothetical protein Vafri_480 [Volvox africanus]